MDAGPAKSMPDGTGLTVHTYRIFRRKMQIFARLCERRGVEAVSEGSLAIILSFTGDVFEALETLLDVDGNLEPANAFKRIIDRRDGHYRYTEGVELPARMENFFQAFHRLPRETLQLYILRHQKELERLKQVGMELPDKLAGWHLLQGSGTPYAQVPNVKAMCCFDLSHQNIQNALVAMFGPDHVAHNQDRAPRHRGAERIRPPTKTTTTSTKRATTKLSSTRTTTTIMATTAPGEPTTRTRRSLRVRYPKNSTISSRRPRTLTSPSPRHVDA